MCCVNLKKKTRRHDAVTNRQKRSDVLIKFFKFQFHLILSNTITYQIKLTLDGLNESINSLVAAAKRTKVFFENGSFFVFSKDVNFSGSVRVRVLV